MKSSQDPHNSNDPAASSLSIAAQDISHSEPILLRPEEAAHLLGVGRTTIYELMRSGELPVVHIGRAARIPTRALRLWVEAHETLSGHTH